MGEGRSMYRVLVGKTKGKRSLGRWSHSWEDGIRMDIWEIVWGVVKWIRLAQDRDQWWALENAVTNLWVLVPQSYLVILTLPTQQQNYVIFQVSKFLDKYETPISKVAAYVNFKLQSVHSCFQKHMDFL
jgi:hypothetical protein